MKTLRILFLLGMAAFVALSVFCFASCSPFIDTKHGIVSAGFLSSTQAFSGKMKSLDGTSVTWSVVGTDGTSVANNAVTTLGSAALANSAFKTVDSNNTAKTTQAKDALDAQTAQKQIEANAQAQAAETARKSAADQLLLGAGHYKPAAGTK